MYTYQNTIQIQLHNINKDTSFTSEFLIFIFLSSFNDIEYLFNIPFSHSNYNIIHFMGYRKYNISNNRTFNVKVDPVIFSDGITLFRYIYYIPVYYQYFYWKIKI